MKLPFINESIFEPIKVQLKEVNLLYIYTGIMPVRCMA